jgi:hypothetical protein
VEGKSERGGEGRGGDEGETGQPRAWLDSTHSDDSSDRDFSSSTHSPSRKRFTCVGRGETGAEGCGGGVRGSGPGVTPPTACVCLSGAAQRAALDGTRPARATRSVAIRILRLCRRRRAQCVVSRAGPSATTRKKIKKSRHFPTHHEEDAALVGDDPAQGEADLDLGRLWHPGGRGGRGGAAGGERRKHARALRYRAFIYDERVGRRGLERRVTRATRALPQARARVQGSVVERGPASPCPPWRSFRRARRCAAENPVPP